MNSDDLRIHDTPVFDSLSGFDGPSQIICEPPKQFPFRPARIEKICLVLSAWGANLLDHPTLRDRAYDLRYCSAENAHVAEGRVQPLEWSLVDLILSPEDDLGLVQRLRQISPELSIIVVGSQRRDASMAYGLGADVYLISPVFHEELLAVSQAQVRRLTFSSSRSTPCHLGGLELWSSWHEIVGPGGCVRLATSETKLLAAFARTSNQHLSKAQIREALGKLDLQQSSVHSIMHRLRGKLEAAGASAPCIVAHRSMGYQLVCPLQLR